MIADKTHNVLSIFFGGYMVTTQTQTNCVSIAVPRIARQMLEDDVAVDMGSIPGQSDLVISRIKQGIRLYQSLTVEGVTFYVGAICLDG